jgi:hypothetical protein
MKKISFFLIIAILFTLQLKSQTVDSIKVEQAADLIKLHYKILNSTPYQIFKVTVFCSINGGLKSELASISGDCGVNVPGGKSEYLVLWDVLKDVDEVKSVDFSVRAELVKDNAPIPKSEHIYIIPNFGGTDAWYYGLRVAYMGSWGVSALYVTGKASDSGPGVPGENVFHTSLDLTKRIIKKGGFEIHLIGGISYGKVRLHSYPTYAKIPTYELGTIITIRRIVLSYAFSSYKSTDTRSLISPFYNYVGIGLRF